MGNFIITNTRKIFKKRSFSEFVQFISQTRGSFAAELIHKENEEAGFFIIINPIKIIL